MTKSIFCLLLTISLIPFLKKNIAAQNITSFVPKEAQVMTAFTPFLLTQKEYKDIQAQTWFKDAIAILNEFLIDKISADSTANLFSINQLNIGLDNTKPWYFTSQRLDNGITHYVLTIPPFKVPDFLTFIQKNQSLFQSTDMKFYQGKFFYFVKNDMLVTWSKHHISIQKFILPNAHKYRAFPVQNAIFFNDVILPSLPTNDQGFTAQINTVIEAYNALSLHLKYKEILLSIGFDFFGKGDMVLAHCVQNKPHALLKILGLVPTSKIYFTLSEKIPFYNQYPALKTIANKKILLEVKDAYSYDLSMQLSRKEILELVNNFYSNK